MLLDVWDLGVPCAKYCSGRASVLALLYNYLDDKDKGICRAKRKSKEERCETTLKRCRKKDKASADSNSIERTTS